jgi:hypothetical protein
VIAIGIDVADDRTWPPQERWRKILSPGGWSVKAIRMDGPFILRDGKSTTVIHDGVLVLTQLKLIGVPIDTFRALYTHFPKEWI